MGETEPATTIRPSKSDARSLIIPIARRNYFTSGGFAIAGDTVHLQARSGRATSLPRSSVDAVVITKGPRGDTRALLTSADGSVLAQDQATFYSDDALRRLADAIGCRLVHNPYRSFANLAKAHPGALRYRWEQRPYLTGLLLGLLICGPLVIVGLLTQYR